MMDSLAKYQPIAMTLLRVYASLSIMQHGTAKILGFPTGSPLTVQSVGTLGWTGGMIELIGGALVLLGLFTRPAAFIVSGFCAVAYFMVHASQSFYPLVNKGELAAVYCFVFFFFVFAGGGPYSLDAIVRKKA